MRLEKIEVLSTVKAEVEVPVVINFFARPDTFAKVLDSVRAAKPSVLFLLSDGPRESVKTDEPNVKKCREIAENIDWQCELYHIYAEKNIGLFDTYFKGMKLVFEVVDRCIFLEDDCVVSKSFFRFSKELLEMYKDDLRFHFISAANHMGLYEEPQSDYFFSGESATPAYAMWKRTFESMTLDFSEDKYILDRTLECAIQMKKGYEKRIKKTVKNPLWEGHVPHTEFYKNLLRFSQSQMFIVPTKNMLCNIGVTSNSVHTADDIKKLPKSMRIILNRKIYEYEFPLRHPKCCVRDLKYEEFINKMTAWGRPFTRFGRKVASLGLCLFYGDFKRIGVKIKGLFIKDNWI